MKESVVDKIKGAFDRGNKSKDFSLPQSSVENGENNSEDERGFWGSRVEFLLSCIGLSVGIGNIWRFPYLAYKNGGAAFLIPYTILLILVGKPIYFLEIALGQFSSLSSVAVWRCCPIAIGVGIAMQVVCFIVCIYYNVVVCYTVFYSAASFAKVLPWKECFDWWGPDNSCYVRSKDGLTSNVTTEITKNITEVLNVTRQTAAQQYWRRYVLHLHESTGIHDLGSIRWDLALCLTFSWIVVFICLSKGIKSSGKVVYFTATFPYVILLVLLIRGVTLEGAGVGLRYLFIPKWHKLTEINIWKDAAEQMFFSLATSWGCLIMLGSYNRFRNKVHIDAFIVSFTDFGTSLIGCIVVFSVLGYLANQLNLDISDVAEKGPGLAFVIYPEALALLPISQLWSFLFFFMLFTLGLDSQFACLEGVVSNLYDFWPKLLKFKTLFTFVSCFILYILGLSCVTQGGQYVFNLLDTFGPSQSILIISLFEMIAITWIYGVRRVIKDFEFMLNIKLSKFWMISWGFICPIFLVTILILSIFYYEPITYGNYVYPSWAIVIGWLIEGLSVVNIPLWAIIMTFIYWRKGNLLGVFRPTKAWGPKDPQIREEWKKLNVTDQRISSPGVMNPAFSVSSSLNSKL